MSKWILTGPALGIGIIAVTLTIAYVVVPPIIVQQVMENVRLVEGTEQYDRWVELPQAMEFKVYIFNVTNVEAVQNGSQPVVEEIGPYVYMQTRRKYNIKFTRDAERVSYYQQQTYHFSQAKSGNLREDDNIVVLNMHMSSVLQTMEAELPFLMQFINNEINNIFGPTDSFFVRTTPRQFFFDGVPFCQNAAGIAQVVCMNVQDRDSPSIVPSPDGTALLFSMFGAKNRTHDGLYEINTGIRRIDRVLRIERWMNSRSLPFWDSDPRGSPSTCQQINGTDGTLAPPFRVPDDTFFLYASDICRSVQLFWDAPDNYNGIDTYRYSTRDNFLNEQDQCFCRMSAGGQMRQANGCLYSGALDLTDCLDAPIVGTMPHFLDADSVYNGLIDGLDADPSKHSLRVDIEPFTGTPVRGGSRMQFNMILRRIEGIQLTNNFNTSRLFPVLWVDEGIELNDELTQLIKDDLTNVLRLIAILQWTFVGIGALLIVGMLTWYFIARSKKGKNSVSTDPIYPGASTTNK